MLVLLDQVVQSLFFLMLWLILRGIFTNKCMMYTNTLRPGSCLGGGSRGARVATHGPAGSPGALLGSPGHHPAGGGKVQLLELPPERGLEPRRARVGRSKSQLGPLPQRGLPPPCSRPDLSQLAPRCRALPGWLQQHRRGSCLLSYSPTLRHSHTQPVKRRSLCSPHSPGWVGNQPHLAAPRGLNSPRLSASS